MNPKEIDILQSYNQGDLELLNPFPGLRPFTFEESHLFFGREGQSDEVLLNLAQHRFTAVIGASGSGKSSLMYCGLIPVLYGGFMTDAGSDWTVLVTRPGISPKHTPQAHGRFEAWKLFQPAFPLPCPMQPCVCPAHRAASSHLRNY